MSFVGRERRFRRCGLAERQRPLRVRVFLADAGLERLYDELELPLARAALADLELVRRR